MTSGCDEAWSRITVGNQYVKAPAGNAGALASERCAAYKNSIAVVSVDFVDFRLIDRNELFHLRREIVDGFSYDLIHKEAPETLFAGA